MVRRYLKKKVIYYLIKTKNLLLNKLKSQFIFSFMFFFFSLDKFSFRKDKTINFIKVSNIYITRYSMQEATLQLSKLYNSDYHGCFLASVIPTQACQNAQLNSDSTKKGHSQKLYEYVSECFQSELPCSLIYTHIFVCFLVLKQNHYCFAIVPHISVQILERKIIFQKSFQIKKNISSNPYKNLWFNIIYTQNYNIILILLRL